MSELGLFLEANEPFLFPEMDEDVVNFCPVCGSPIVDESRRCDFGCKKNGRSFNGRARYETIERIAEEIGRRCSPESI